MVVYIKSPKEFTKKKKKILELRSEVSKVVGYKSHTQKPMASLYTNSEHLKTKIKNSILFIIVPKKMARLGTNRTNIDRMYMLKLWNAK